ncbi:hypothetical protein GRC12_44055, partial [Streptomyces griseorubiginosus]|nr:hypothetical protein [Streptomyces griseorubiginosus]
MTPDTMTSATLTSDTAILTIAEAGPALETGARPVLILHGGGGPLTVAPIARHLS